MTIAVAHQASATGRAALTEAVREARVRQTDLVVIHVVTGLDADTSEAYRLGISDAIEKAAGAGPDVSWDLRLATASDDLADVIVEVTEKADAELLVIGARRRSPVGKALLGSVAQTVILDATVPVLVVKA